MANYQQYTEEEQILFVATEHPMYGSSRVGVDNRIDTLYKNGTYNPAWYTNNKSIRNLGLKSFELSNHLGNVLVTISDKKVYVLNGANITFEPEITTISDYYPFGSAINTRSYSSGAYTDSYRYGFNGKEKDPESFNDAYDFGARIYDGRLGRWLSLDPASKNFPYESNYVFVSNSPLIYVDINGKTKYLITNTYNEATGETTTIKVVINDDLQKGISRHDSPYSNDYVDYVGFYDINIVQNITIKKDGTVVKSPKTQETGDLRYENHPLFDKLGFRNTQTKVNEHLKSIKDPKQKKWGGIHWTWSSGQGRETKQGDCSVRIENIDNLMDKIMGANSSDFNIPSTLVKDNDAMLIIKILYESLDKAVSSTDAVKQGKDVVDKFIDEVNKWKDDNLVLKCDHNWIYDNQGNMINTTGEVPKGKEVSKDKYDCYKKEVIKE